MSTDYRKIVNLLDEMDQVATVTLRKGSSCGKTEQLLDIAPGIRCYRLDSGVMLAGTDSALNEFAKLAQDEKREKFKARVVERLRQNGVV